jgi:hypothetical protein
LGVALLRTDPYELVKEAIYREYIAGENLVAIARDLNLRRVPTRHAKTWHAATVLRIISRMPRSERVKRDA